jgi:hypothetical protein
MRDAAFTVEGRVNSREGDLPEFSCIWSQIDSTTADGWTHKSSFNDASTAHFTGSRDPGEVPNRKRMDSQRHEQSSRLPFSRDTNTNLSDADLTTLLRLHAPLQLPSQLRNQRSSGRNQLMADLAFLSLQRGLWLCTNRSIPTERFVGRGS